MDDKHYLLYRNLIEWEQQDKLIASNGHFYLNGREVEHYVFMHNYYFMGGDNCYNSQDSLLGAFAGGIYCRKGDIDMEV